VRKKADRYCKWGEALRAKLGFSFRKNQTIDPLVAYRFVWIW
jgi:hypothetical protein